MATALVCEICGGKLTGKPGGIFECDSCGMEYSTEWAKAKIQEIKGTVKVEGTVEVQGTVKVDGPIKVEGAANARSLLKRGQMALEDGEFEEAETYFNRVLDRDPKCGAAYWGLALADACGDIERLAKYCLEQETTEIKRARKFADDETRALLAKLDKTKPHVKQRLKEEKEAYERKLEEDRLAYAAARQRPELAKNLIAAKGDHTVGLKSDGTVVAVGSKTFGKCKVSDWTDIVAVSAGRDHTVGLKSDGTVVAVGWNKTGRCDVSDWTDITAVSAGLEHTVGLRSNGTVVATKFKEDKIYKHFGQCDVSEWTDIVAVSAGGSHTVGLKSDGTLVAVGNNRSGQCNVSVWKDIVSVSAGYDHTVGLWSDGTVGAVGYNKYGQCKVSDWTDIVAVSAGGHHTVGLRTDGTVVAVGKNDQGECDVSDWTDIVAVSAGFYHTVGLKSDGTVVATKFRESTYIRYSGQCNVSGWKLFDSIDTLEQEQEKVKAKALCRQQVAEYEEEPIIEEEPITEEELCRLIEEAEAENKRENKNPITQLKAEKSHIQTELNDLEGRLFSGKRRRELEARLAQIEKELKTLQ